MFAHSVSKISRWLKNRFDVRLGAQLWALELELPKDARRTWKFSLLARAAGRLYAAGILKMPDLEAEAAYGQLVADLAWVMLTRPWTPSLMVLGMDQVEILRRVGRTRNELHLDARVRWAELRMVSTA